MMKVPQAHVVCRLLTDSDTHGTVTNRVVDLFGHTWHNNARHVSTLLRISSRSQPTYLNMLFVQGESLRGRRKLSLPERKQIEQGVVQTEGGGRSQLGAVKAGDLQML